MAADTLVATPDPDEPTPVVQYHSGMFTVAGPWWEPRTTATTATTVAMTWTHTSNIRSEAAL